MSIAERRETERQALRKKIFDAASEIILRDGYDKLSIRKIAKEIQYSPAVIYNYFEDKAEIVSCIIKENTNRIFSSLNNLGLDKMSPDIALRTGLTTFLWLMIENPNQYRAIMLNGIYAEDRHTNLNDKTAQADGSKSLLISVLESGKEKGILREINSEVGAMLLIAAATGLVCRIITSNITDKEVLDLLINTFVDVQVIGMMKNI